ncbi:MAG: sigma-70 family RNA polymerase sigma factor [Planctomycetota bacterium]
MALLDAEEGRVGKRVHGRLWRLTQRDDVAEELMQELVMKLAGSAGFGGAASPVAYAMRAATNLALDWRRERVRRGGEVAWSDQGTERDEPVGVLVRDEEFTRVLDALSGLKETDRVVVTMRYLEGAEYAAVGQALGKTAAQARGLCAKAIGRLRKRLKVVTPMEVKP